MTIRSIFKAGESDREKELMRKIDKIGAEVNAKNNVLCRPSSEINHLAVEYDKEKKVLNGLTKGIEVRQIYRDELVKELEVVFNSFGYSPQHRHPHYSVINVVKGRINDPVRKLDYEEGDWYLISKGEEHATQSVDGAIMHVYNTDSKLVADTILIYQGYDPNHPLLDRLKINES